MKILYWCQDADDRTGIGRLVSSIICQSKKTFNCLEVVLLCSQDIIFFNKQKKIISNLLQIRRQIKSVDMIHVFDLWPHGFLAWLLSFNTGKPIILTLVGTGSVKPLNNYFLKLVLGKIMHDCYQITAISSYVCGRVLSKVPGLHIKVICPGVDYNYWSNSEGNFSVDGLPSHADFILSVGSFKRRKGYHTSLAIFKRINQLFPDLFYVIVGVGSKNNFYYQKIIQQIKSDDLINKVIITGHLSDEQLKNVYHRAKFFWLLSQDDNDDIEGFGLVFLEAAAAGLPVIGCRNTGANDAICDKYNGFLVDISEEDDILQKISSLLTDKMIHQQFSVNSRQFARVMTDENLVNNYVEIYKKFQS